MEEMAQVIRLLDGNHCEVMLRRHSACGHCGQCSHGSGEPSIFEVANTLNAEVGDMVLLEMETGNLLKAVLVIYLLPLVNLILGYFLGYWLNSILQITKGEGFAVASGLIVMALTFLFVRFYDKRAGGQSEFKPRMTQILYE